VGFGGAMAHMDLSCDGRVGMALGHKVEDFTFTVGQSFEGIVLPGSMDEPADHLGVNSAAAFGHSDESIEEIVDLSDAVFQEVADPGRSFFY